MNTSIELWRFLFTIMVCLLHFNSTYFSRKSYFSGGYIAVEFFFILSGFLLMNSAERKGSKQSALTYTIRKMKGFYPHYIFSLSIIFIYKMVEERETLFGILKKMVQVFWEVTMLHMSGIKYSKLYNYITWYISVLIIVGYIIYYLVCNYRKIFIELIAPVAILLIYGYYSFNIGYMDVWIPKLFGVRICLLRGFAGMSLGCLCYSIYKRNKQRVFTKAMFNMLNIIKIFSFCFVIVFAALRGRTQYDFILIVALSVGVTISFLTNSSKSQPIENILLFLGKLSYPIYLNHELLKILFAKYIPGKGHSMFLVFILVTIVYSYITDKIVKAFNSSLLKSKLYMKIEKAFEKSKEDV